MPVPPNHDDPQPEDDLNSDEDLRLQNELLKLKMQAELGAEFGGDMSELPPEIERQVLEQVMRFHEAQAMGEVRTVGQQMGREDWPGAYSFSSASELAAAWDDLQKALTVQRIHVSFLAEYPLALKWDFVTQELMKKETISLGALAELGDIAIDAETDEDDADDADDADDDDQEDSAADADDPENGGLPPGLTSGGFIGFIYEEFHPNHAYDIERQVHNTLQDFFENHFGEWSSHISEPMITSQGQTLSQKQFVEKVARFHDLFAGIKEWSYEIFETAWQTDESDNGALTGMGHVEGGVSYIVLTDDGAESEVNGPFKAYAELRDGWWSVYFFHLHGFSWA